MKTMTYAQKADLVAKCKRVFESVRRSNQVVVAEKYRTLALKAIGNDHSLGGGVDQSFNEMNIRIKNKPRYRYDNRAEKWVECEARDLYGKSIVSGYADIERQKNAFYARMASNMPDQGQQGAAFGTTLGLAGNPLTGW